MKSDSSTVKQEADCFSAFRDLWDDGYKQREKRITYDLQNDCNGLCAESQKVADEIEQVINEKAKDGWELVTFSVTNSCKAILVFRVPEDA